MYYIFFKKKKKYQRYLREVYRDIIDYNTTYKVISLSPYAPF